MASLVIWAGLWCEQDLPTPALPVSGALEVSLEV